MHVPGSRLGNYRTRWTFYWLDLQEFSGGFNKILLGFKKRKKKSRDLKIAQIHIFVFSTTFLHAYIPFLLVIKTTF